MFNIDATILSVSGSVCRIHVRTYICICVYEVCSFADEVDADVPRGGALQDGGEPERAGHATTRATPARRAHPRAARQAGLAAEHTQGTIT